MLDFFVALEKNDVATVKNIIKQYGANYIISDQIFPGYKRPLLHWAIRNFDPRPEIVETLLENGADPNYKVYGTYHYDSILSEFFDKAVFDYKHDCEYHFENRLRIAHIFFKYSIKPVAKDFECLEHELLHGNGSYSNAITQYENAFTHKVTSIYRGAPFLDKIFALFYDVKIYKFKELTLPNKFPAQKDKTIVFNPSEEFVYAIIRGDTKTAKALLEAKLVDANSIISDGRNSRPPLLHALYQRWKASNVDMVKLLLDYGANPNYAAHISLMDYLKGLADKKESIISCYLHYVQSFLEYSLNNHEKEGSRIKDEFNIAIAIGKLLLQYGAVPTKADLQYLEKCINEHLENFYSKPKPEKTFLNITKFETDPVYVYGSKPWTDRLIDLFDDPTIHHIKRINLSAEDLALYFAYHKTEYNHANIKCLLEHKYEIQDTLQATLVSANSSLEKAILSRDLKAITTDTLQPMSDRVEKNLKVANQLMKGIFRQKMWEDTCEQISEKLVTWMPG